MRKSGINFHFAKRGSFVIKFSTGTTGKELVSIYKDSKILKNLSPILITFQQ